MVEITIRNGYVVCPECGQVAEMVEHYHDGWAEYQCTDRECAWVFDVDDPESEQDVRANVALDKLSDDADMLLSMTERDKEDMRDMEWEREQERDEETYEDYAHLLPRLE